MYKPEKLVLSDDYDKNSIKYPYNYIITII